MQVWCPGEAPSCLVRVLSGKNSKSFSPASDPLRCKATYRWINTYIDPSFSERNITWYARVKYNATQGWRDGPADRSTGFSCRGPGFSAQHPHGDSWSSVTPGPGDAVPASDLHGWHACTHYPSIHANSHSQKRVTKKSLCIMHPLYSWEAHAITSISAVKRGVSQEKVVCNF